MENLPLQDIIDKKIQYIKNRFPEEKIEIDVFPLF